MSLILRPKHFLSMYGYVGLSFLLLPFFQRMHQYALSYLYWMRKLHFIWIIWERTLSVYFGNECDWTILFYLKKAAGWCPILYVENWSSQSLIPLAWLMATEHSCAVGLLLFWINILCSYITQITPEFRTPFSYSRIT